MTALLLLSLSATPRSLRAESRTTGFTFDAGASLSLDSARAERDGGGRSMVFVGYVPDYRLFELDRMRARGFTDLVLFSLKPGPDGALLDEFGLLTRMGRLVERPRPYRVLLALGGGQRSADFRAMASTEAARTRFLDALEKVVEAHDLDGVDLDWEHLDSPAELALYEDFVLALRRRLGERLLTIALSDPRLLTPSVAAAVDRVHLMAYDGPRHATLDQARALVEAALKRGVPPARLCLGIPLFATGRGARSPSSWREVTRRHRPGPSVDEVDGLQFNGLDTTRAKARWLSQRGLGGVFFWEVTQDAFGTASLIEATRDELRASLDAPGR